MDKPIKAIARMQSFTTREGHPLEYHKAHMWNDLNDLLAYSSALEAKFEACQKRNAKLRENLERFAPGEPTVGDFPQ